MSVTQDFLKGAAGQRTQHSHLGKWATALAKIIEGGVVNVRLTDLLRAAQGEISLHSPFGRFAMQLSQGIDSGAVQKTMVADMFRSSASVQQIQSPYGDFQVSAILRSP